MRRRQMPTGRRVVRLPDASPLSSQTTARLPSRTPLPTSSVPTQRNPRVPARSKLIFAAIVIAGVAYLLSADRTVSQKALAIVATKPQTVCLDPGHGGSDPGASNNNITERDINLTVALGVRDLLQSQGYKVYMTRTTNDPTLSNADRYHYCNNQKATIMVSIHHNYFTDTSVDYDSSLYYKPQDLALATSIVAATSSKLGLSNNGVASFQDGVLSESNMPASLSEGFFITNDAEYAKLTAPGSTRLTDEAAGIDAGIIGYFANPSPPATPPGSTPPPVLDRAD